MVLYYSCHTYNQKGTCILYKKSLLIRLIIFGSVFSVLPVVFVGVFSYIQSSNQVQDRVNEAELQILKQVNSNVEQVLKTVDHTLTNLVDSKVMFDALYSQLGASNFILYNNLKSEITHLQSFDTKVEEVIIVNKLQDWIVRNSGIKRLGSHSDADKYLSLFELDNSSSWVLLEKNQFTDSITSTNCNYMLSLVKKLPSIQTDKYGLVLANIPACSIASMIDDRNKSEEVMVLNSDNQIIAHSDMEMVGRTLSQHPLLTSDINFSDQSGQMQLSSDKHPYTVTYHKSKYNDWTYLSIVSIEELTKESRSIGWFTFLISLIIIVVSIIFVLLTSNRLYSPLKQLVKAIKGGNQPSEDRPQSEVQVIEAHINQLFYSNSKLQYEVKSQAQQISSLFLQRLYAGNLKKAEIDGKMDYFGFSHDVAEWSYMTVLALQVDTLENTRYEPKDMELLLFAMLNISEEVIAKESRLPAVLVDRSVVMLIGSGESDKQQVEEKIYQMTEALKSSIEQYFDFSISIGFSGMFEHIQDASKGYDEAIEALKYRIRLGKGLVIPFSSVNLGKASLVYEYPTRIEHELIDAIKSGDLSEALKSLDLWMAEAIDKVKSPSEYQLSLVRLLNRLLILRQESGISINGAETYKMSLYDQVLSLHVSEEIKEWFKEKLIQPLQQFFIERRNSQDQNLSEKIIGLIQNHYDTEFTLEDCAAKLHYNASYLSNVFKRETGLTFSEYMASFRIQMAKQWLTETAMPVKEIADRLKYTNSHNFIRSFRKQEGMTPGQYRTKYSEYKG